MIFWARGENGENDFSKSDNRGEMRVVEFMVYLVRYDAEPHWVRQLLIIVNPVSAHTAFEV